MNKNVVVEVPRSGKRVQFTNQLTGKLGTITPIFVEECLPAQKTRLEMAIKCSLPPLASDAFMNVKLKCEAFFVPMRLLCGSFESFFASNLERIIGDDGLPDEISGFCPYMSFDYSKANIASDFDLYTQPGSLADFLGWKKFNTQPSNAVTINVPMMPFLAYHKIWNDCYRNSRITQPCFARTLYFNSSGYRDYVLATSPYVFFEHGSGVNDDDIVYDSVLGPTKVNFLADDVNIFGLRQRNYGYDYFTMAMPTPQLGNVRQVAVSHPSGNTGYFTIAALRAENALQQFADRNGLGGLRIQDVVKQRYGADLSGLVAQQAICIGACDYDVYTDGVTNNQQSTPTASNPLSGFGGSRSGVAYAQGHDLIIDDFVSNEPGYLFVMATLVPKAQYRTGIRRYLQHFIGDGSITDLADPILQSVGPQPIYNWELASHFIGQNTQIFGYTDRYAEYFSHENEIHSLFSRGESLENFVSARDFVLGTPAINTQFLEIQENDLDNVTAVAAQLSNYGYMLQVAFDLSKILPLQDYSLPTLQDPAYEHGKRISIIRGGFKL